MSLATLSFMPSRDTVTNVKPVKSRSRVPTLAVTKETASFPMLPLLSNTKLRFVKKAKATAAIQERTFAAWSWTGFAGSRSVFVKIQ